MPRTLLTKLTLALAALMLVVGAIAMALTLWVNHLYLVEMQQQINRDVAEHIVHERILLHEGEIDREGLEHVFHMMMVIHPSIELYLLDVDGRILAYSAPEGKVKGVRVDLQPLHAFLEGARLPVLGDDPRHPGSPKPFSAAEIRDGGGLEGYLYIIVGGEPYASAVAQLAGSYATRLGVTILALGVLLALATGYWLFRWIVGRLASLNDAMRRFEASRFREAPKLPAARRGRRGDEIDDLRRSFDVMGRRITELLATIERADAQRRELIASISHDLRTPLAALRGYLETLTLKGDDLSLEERRNCVSIAQRQAEKLHRLIDDLFELSKLDSGQVELRREPFSIAELIQDVVQKFDIEASRRRIRLYAEVSHPIPLVDADVGLIERVLDNLLENAIKYTDDGGDVRVAIRPQGSAVVVAISDTGQGIPPEELPRIFDRYYRARAAKDGGESGSGLGLTIAARILDLHASSIDASSTPGRGTTFRFDLPAQAAPPPV